jgi:hypothetical protein
MAIVGQKKSCAQAKYCNESKISCRKRETIPKNTYGHLYSSSTAIVFGDGSKDLARDCTLLYVSRVGSSPVWELTREKEGLWEHRRYSKRNDTHSEV